MQCALRRMGTRRGLPTTATPHTQRRSARVTSVVTGRRLRPEAPRRTTRRKLLTFVAEAYPVNFQAIRRIAAFDRILCQWACATAPAGKQYAADTGVGAASGFPLSHNRRGAGVTARPFVLYLRHAGRREAALDAPLRRRPLREVSEGDEGDERVNARHEQIPSAAARRAREAEGRRSSCGAPRPGSPFSPRVIPATQPGKECQATSKSGVNGNCLQHRQSATPAAAAATTPRPI